MQNHTANLNPPSPITISDDARAYIQNYLKPLGDHAGFKIGVKKSGCSGFSYVADVAAKPGHDDLCLDENGLRIFIDNASLPILQGTIIDLVDKGLHQKQLHFNNPNVEDSCGCGESFTVKSAENESDG